MLSSGKRGFTGIKTRVYLHIGASDVTLAPTFLYFASKTTVRLPGTITFLSAAFKAKGENDAVSVRRRCKSYESGAIRETFLPQNSILPICPHQKFY